MADKKENVTALYQANMQALREMRKLFSATKEGSKYTSVIEQVPKQDPSGWEKWVNIMGTYARIADPEIRVSDTEVDDVLGLIKNSWEDLEEWMDIVHHCQESRELRAKFSGIKGQLDYAETRWDKIIALDSFIGTAHKHEPFALPVLCGVQDATHHVALGVLTQYIMTYLADERS